MLCAVYRPPDAVDSFLTQVYDYLLPYRDRNVILTGDFNLPTINWQRPLYEQYQPNNDILNILFAFNLTQLVREPTRENSILDLFFTSQEFSNGELTVETGISDHRLLYFCCDLSSVQSRTSLSASTVKDYDRADDVSIIDYLEIELGKPVSENVPC